MRYGSIYKITCLINDKIYIGQTVQNPPIKRWLDHYDEMNRTNNQLLLYRALRRWGLENFAFQILEENIELSKLNEKEIYRENVSEDEANNFRINESNYNKTLNESIYSYEINKNLNLLNETLKKIEISNIKNIFYHKTYEASLNTQLFIKELTTNLTYIFSIFVKNI